jgi:predicted amidohydrolase
MRLSLVQLRAARANPEANLEIGIEACARARAQGAELVVFPELWQLGYAACPESGPDRDRWLGYAEKTDGAWVGAFREAAAAQQLAIVATFLRRAESGLRNTALVIDTYGAAVLLHDKVHLCDFTWEHALEPGTGFDAAPVATQAGIVRLGIMTCFDREFPESARELALAGAELIISPNASLICDDRLGQLRCRAFENMAAVALANYPRPFMNGRSCVFDGIAMAGRRPRDHQVFIADARPGLYTVDVNLDELRQYRADGLWQQQRRRPAAYRRIADAGPGQEPNES